MPNKSVRAQHGRMKERKRQNFRIEILMKIHMHAQDSNCEFKKKVLLFVIK